MSRYRGRHDSQYKTGNSARLRSMGCTVVSLGNALRNVTGGKVDLSGDQILAKVANFEETNPATPGWSLQDAQKAASRITGAPPLVIRSGSWSRLQEDRAAGRIIILQGDSDRFPNGTCSGAFDGNHAVAWHPDGDLGDPICPGWRSETEAVLRAYAEKLWGLSIQWGTFEAPVPPTPQPAPQEPTRMIGGKHAGPPMGTVTLGVGHQLISPVDTRQRFGPWPDPLVLNAYDRISLRSYPGRVPTDIDGSVPPSDERGECWVVDLPNFDDMALALVGDCGPLVPASADLAIMLGPGLYRVP